MNRSSTIALFVIAALIPVTAARADSLEEKRFKEQHEKSQKLNIDETNKRCGTAITATIDWTSVKFEDWQLKLGGNPYQSIGNAISDICKKDDGKAAVKAGIKSIVVRNDPTGPKMELTKGELVFYLSFGPKHGCCYSMTSGDAEAYLMKHI